MNTRKVHRTLRLTTPLLKGSDIEALQDAANRRATPRGIDRTDVDGEYGPDTRRLIRQVIYAMGGPVKKFDREGATLKFQRIIRLEKSRPAVWLVRAKKRAAKRSGKRTSSKVLKWAQSQIGVSNRYVNPVLRWLNETGIGPAPWCGAFVVKALRQAGLEARSEWRYVPWLLADARNGVLGYRVVKDPRPGDLVCFKWPGVSRDTADHVGLVETVQNGRMVASIEGNTSGNSSGSQHNGDSCQRKFRNEYGVVAYIRPPYQK